MTEKTGAEDLGGCVISLATLPLVALLEAAVIVALWGWFLVPLGLPAVGKAEAYGLAVLVAFLTKSPHAASRDDDPIKVLARNIVWALSALATGYIAHRLT